MSKAEKINIIANYIVVRYGHSIDRALQEASEKDDLDGYASLALSELIENAPYRFQPLC